MPRWIKILACALGVAWLASVCFEIAVVPTPSMERTVLVGDHLLVLKLFRAPKKGSIVSFRAPGEPRYTYLKRIVAVAGDCVEIRAGVLFVNKVPERNAFAQSRVPRVRWLAARVLARDQLFVLGDNRDLSEDSRDFGPISTSSVVGTPVAVLWSVRARTADLVDAHGNLSTRFYIRTLRHFVARTRWSRTGLLL